MTAHTRHAHNTFGRTARRLVACACALALVAPVGCKSTKEPQGTGVSRGKDKSDPLVHGPTKIPKQDLPLPDRATGPKGKFDPLTSPTGGGKAGYSDDPERFKGTFIPGEKSTPAALAGRGKDDEGLRIDSPGVPLTPAGGVVSGGVLEAPEGVAPLYSQLDKYGVAPNDRSLTREDGKYVFRASVPISGNGARREYAGVAATAPDAVRQVIDQVAADRK
jgi:hypothetical protein